MFYKKLLRELAPGLNPAGVEASMRLHYGVLNHLPRDTLAEALLAADLESGSPGILRKIAESMGMAEDFAKWEAGNDAWSRPAPPDRTGRCYSCMGG